MIRSKISCPYVYKSHFTKYVVLINLPRLGMTYIFWSVKKSTFTWAMSYKFYVMSPTEINLYDTVHVTIDFISENVCHTHTWNVCLNYFFCRMWNIMRKYSNHITFFYGKVFMNYFIVSWPSQPQICGCQVSLMKASIFLFCILWKNRRLFSHIM